MDPGPPALPQKMNDALLERLQRIEHENIAMKRGLVGIMEHIERCTKPGERRRSGVYMTASRALQLGQG